MMNRFINLNFGNILKLSFGALFILILLQSAVMVTQRIFFDIYPKPALKYSRWMSNTLPLDQWQSIGEPNRRHKIYSAFFDDRLEVVAKHRLDNDHQRLYGSVRVFAILTTAIKYKLRCRFRNASNETLLVNAFKVAATAIPENRNMSFSAFMITCPLTVSEGEKNVELPNYVALEYDQDKLTIENPTFAPIHFSNPKTATDTDRNLAVCVGVIHSNYSQSRRIVEFVHIYKLMGATKFYFYNLSATDEVNSVILHLEQQGYAQILNWNLHGYEFEKELRIAGIFAALNECIYRATFVDNFKYIVLVDFDEIVVSLKHANLVEFLEKVDSSEIGSFQFRGVFFHPEDKNEVNDQTAPTQDYVNRFLYTQSRVVRTRDPWHPHIRSKYVVKGRAAIEGGNHFMWRLLSGFKEKTIPVNDGLLFHYRDVCLSLTCKAARVNDTTMKRYGMQLRRLVDDTCKEVFESGICPV